MKKNTVNKLTYDLKYPAITTISNQLKINIYSIFCLPNRFTLLSTAIMLAWHLLH